MELAEESGMKGLRRVLLTVLLAAQLAVLSSCIWVPKYASYDIAEEKLASVDIYDLRDCSSRADFYESEFSDYTLKAEQIDGFVAALESLRFDDSTFFVLAATDPNFTYGDWVVRLNYTDGTYTLISSDGFGATYDQDYNVIDSNHYSYDDKKWEQFVCQYLPTELQPQ